MKTYLGVGGTTGKSRVYLSADCLEIEEDLTVDVIRRRIYLDDVLMVTHSRRFGWNFLLTMGICSGTFALGTLGCLIGGEIGVAVLLALISIGFVVPMVVRLITRIDVITIFGRRKRAEITFGMNKALVQSHFEKICAAVRQTIEATHARLEREKPPAPIQEPISDFEPLPPLQNRDREGAAVSAEVLPLPNDAHEIQASFIPATPVEVLPELPTAAQVAEPDLAPPPPLAEPEFPKSE